MAILYPTSLANLVVEVGTRHCHQTLLASACCKICLCSMTMITLTHINDFSVFSFYKIHTLAYIHSSPAKHTAVVSAICPCGPCFNIKIIFPDIGITIMKRRQSLGGWFNIKMSSYHYRKSHCGDKTILLPSYLHNGISYTGKMASLYWIRTQTILTL